MRRPSTTIRMVWTCCSVAYTVQLVQDPATGGTFVVKSLPRCHMVSRERLTIIPHGVPYMTKLLRYFVSEDSIFLHLEHVQGGTLWSHLLSQAHPRHSGLRSDSTQEKMKAQLNPHLNLLSPARLPSGHAPGQVRIALEPPRTSLSLPPAGEAPSTRPQRETEGEPTDRTSTSGSLDLPKAPSDHLYLQARRAGQNSDTGTSQGLTWVPEGAGPVLGKNQSCLSADGAGPGCGSATWRVREEQVKQWAAETLVALEALHEQGVLCRDLHPENLLLDQAEGHIRLTYFGQWSEVEPQCCGEALDNLYSAPEVGGISELTEACDWWSFGSILYELLTGMALSQSHPSGIQAHTQLQLPDWLSRPAASLLTELLQFEPTRRLGVGEGGVSKLKSHPFFSTIQWSKLVGSSSALWDLLPSHDRPSQRNGLTARVISRQELWKDKAVFKPGCHHTCHLQSRLATNSIHSPSLTSASRWPSTLTCSSVLTLSILVHEVIKSK
ncbi:ribosomal protein S6 kinase-like 1 isoform X11 [Sapajus apella]|uniref:Ribosomal protein S6 kinase-like 1 isoform X11 n=1 Tax=Sapajus apella TaxID=9515 RepID=A0A6J3IP48_SAPAP|nr:ribosomal protein S6 kinase-like 1 isoform X11 [Sapajus apella]